MLISICVWFEEYEISQYELYLIYRSLYLQNIKDILLKTIFYIQYSCR